MLEAAEKALAALQLSAPGNADAEDAQYHVQQIRLLLAGDYKGLWESERKRSQKLQARLDATKVSPLLAACLGQQESREPHDRLRVLRWLTAERQSRPLWCDIPVSGGCGAGAGAAAAGAAVESGDEDLYS